MADGLNQMSGRRITAADLGYTVADVPGGKGGLLLDEDGTVVVATAELMRAWIDGAFHQRQFQRMSTEYGTVDLIKAWQAGQTHEKRCRREGRRNR